MKKLAIILGTLVILGACAPETIPESVSPSFDSGVSYSGADISSDDSSSISDGATSSSDSGSPSSETSEDARSDLQKEFDRYPSDIKELFSSSIGDRAIPYMPGSSYQGLNSNYQNTEITMTSLVIYGVSATSFDDYGVSCEKHGFIIDSESDDKYNYAYLQGNDGVTLIVSYAYFNKAYPYFALYAYLY